MTLMNRHPRTLQFALILLILLVLPFQTTVLGRKRQANRTRRSATRAEKGKKLSAKERRQGRRHERLSARQSRRGGKTRLSRRELRRERNLSAREQAAELKALERRLRRPLTKRERAAALRGNSARRRREIMEARRRAEAARRAAIAREKAMRDEAQTFISRDDTTGEDPEVRRVAVNALGYHAGTVVVMDPMTGKIYSVVNQEWALRRGFKPCSTVKLVTGVAGLEEKVISPFETTNVSDKYQLDLTDALAYSNNTYFQHVGGQVGFDKMMSHARDLGLGEKTGVNAQSEYSGRLPSEKTGFALNRMSSHGDDFEVTALQLGTLVSALANGGKLLVPYVPRNGESKAKPKVRRQIDVSQENLRRMVPGMVGAVNYGSGKKAYDPLQTVAGKTGTCIGQGSWLGLFTSYAPLANPRLAVVVIARGSDGRNHFPAAVAGRIYRDLGGRFGTPINLQLATGRPGNDSKAAELNEEDKEAAEAEAAESEASTGDANGSDTATTAPAPMETPRSTVNQTAAPRDSVKRVLMPIETRGSQVQKPETKSTATRTSFKPPTQTADRPRRTQP